MRAAPPGPQLGAGRVRVDAARAIAKLREYQLADRTAWVLEAIRAGVAAGASELELRGDDANVWLAWRGDPLAGDDIVRLFDELVSPEPASERQAVRLLAGAVNSALGTSPAHVDVVALAGDGSAQRVRYTPEVLAEPSDELAESPLRQVALEQVAVPEWPGPGVLVHLRRAWSLRRLSSLFWEREVPELALARQSCRDIAVPLRIGRDTLHRDAERDLVRIPLGEGLDGYLAIVDPDRMMWPDFAARFDVAEHGVVLARYAIDLAVEAARAPVPVRLFVDAPRMPTNASRSEVRRDLHPLTTAHARAQVVIKEALAQLAARAEREPAARAAALALLAAAIAVPERAAEAIAVRPVLKPLAALSLVRDASGAPRTITCDWNGLVHTGSAPFAEELAPWLANVLWVPPGDASTRLIVGRELDPGALRRHLRAARRQRRAERRFFEHAPRPAEVSPPARQPLVTYRLGEPVPRSCVPADVFADLTGEVCIDAIRTGGELTLLYHGREIERRTFDSPIGFAAVIDSPTLRPQPDYRGVVDDAALARVEYAMRAAVVCAIETLLVDPDEQVPADEARLVRHAIALARGLELPVQRPLSAAAVWPIVGGTQVSLDKLRAQRAIGIAPRGTQIVTGGDRIVVYAGEHEATLRAAIAPTRAVRYDVLRTGHTDVRALARALSIEHGHALVVQDAELFGAIAPAGVASLALHHMGVALASKPYRPRHVACAIAIDSDAIVPDDAWKTVVDDAGLADRDYGSWERQLVRAAAAALAGHPPDELIGLGLVGPRSPIARALFEAIAHGDGLAMIGPELTQLLRTHPWLPLHGEVAPRSIATLVERFAGALPFVDGTAAPVAGFTPLEGDGLLALAVGKLAEREVYDAAGELEGRRLATLRDLRLAALRVQPRQPLAIAGEGPCVAIELAGAPGLVGVGADELAIAVQLEGRPFLTLRRAGRVPLHAVVDLAVDAADAALVDLPPDTASALIACVERAAGPLLLEWARAWPEALVEPGPVRDLLAAATLDPASRGALCEIPAFATVQGERVSIDRATRAANALYVASWQGDWLGPEPGATRSAFDEPVLYVPDNAEGLRDALRRLYDGAIVDAGDELAQLQVRRRMAHGLVPTPQVAVAPRFKRKLAELGSQLGIGEVGLVEHAGSRALLHAQGELRETIELAVLPAVDVALEAPDLLLHASQVEPTASALDQLRALVGEDARQPALGAQIEALALALARRVLAEVPAGELPAGIRRNLASAVLAGRLPASDVAELPLFETAGGAWIDWGAVEAQRTLFGDIWAVPVRTTQRPLDDRRVALHLGAGDIERARAAGLPVTDATQDLELDERARKNRERLPAQSLAIHPRDGVLAEVALEGPVRGTIAVLAPDAAHRRALHPHRAMHPFDASPDPCRWPTLALVDDPRLEPDRTWEHPLAGEAWFDVLSRVRAASARGVMRAVEPSPDALVSARLAMLDLPSLRRHPQLQLCGALWLVGPLEQLRIDVRGATSTFGYVPRELGLAGCVYVHAPGDWDGQLVLGELCAELHARLLRALPSVRNLDAEIVAAHVAHGLSLGRLAASDASRVRFACFRPQPLDAGELVALLRGDEGVRIVGVGDDPDVPGLVDDDSPLARVLIAAFGERVHRGESPHLSTPLAAPVTSGHALQPVVDALIDRLFAIGVPLPFGFVIDTERDQPLVRFDGSIRLAGEAPRLHAVANALAARSPWAAGAIDALVAHTLTVLNVALTQITDATEATALGRLLAE